MENLLKDFIKSEKVSNRIRREINTHEESGYLNVVIDKNHNGNYILKNTLFTKLDRRKVKWAGEIVDQRKVFLFKVHDLSSEMVYKGYFNTPENILSKYVPEILCHLNFSVN